MNKLHHFLYVPCIAGRMLKIQAIGETTKSAHKIGILMKAKRKAVSKLKRNVKAKITENTN